MMGMMEGFNYTLMTSPSGLSAWVDSGAAPGLSLPLIRVKYNCTGSCEGAFEHFLEHPTWNCEGAPNMFPGGSWQGHVFPGVIFMVWATHWLIGFIRHYFHCLIHNEPYRSKSYNALFMLPEPLEPFIKATLPFLNIMLEVWLAHATGYKRMLCAPGTMRAGAMDSNSLGNWQHATMYPGFIVSGMVDLISIKFDVPAGTTHLFLGLSYFCEALLFGLHKKHTPMDILVHELLTYSAVSCAVFSLCEAAWLGNPLLTAGRICSLYLQSAWFFAAARMMFEHRVAWDSNFESDSAPVWSMAVLFIQLATVIVLGMVAAFLLGFAVYRPQLGKVLTGAGSASSRQISSQEDSSAEHLYA